MARQCGVPFPMLPRTSSLGLAADSEPHRAVILHTRSAFEQQYTAAAGFAAYAPGLTVDTCLDNSISEDADDMTGDSYISTDEYNTEDEEEENNACPMDEDDSQAAAVAFAQQQQAETAPRAASATAVNLDQWPPSPQPQQHDTLTKQTMLVHTPLTPPSSPACSAAFTSLQQLQHLGQHIHTLFSKSSPPGSSSDPSWCSSSAECSSAYAPDNSSSSTSRCWECSPGVAVSGSRPGTPVCALRGVSVTATPPPSPAGLSHGY